MSDNPRPHSDDCEVAWTITLHHDGRVVFEPCQNMDPAQAETARRLLEWFCPGCPHDESHGPAVSAQTKGK